VGHGHHGFADGSAEVCKLRVTEALGNGVGGSVGADVATAVGEVVVAADYVLVVLAVYEKAYHEHTS
jgi:hypothetical protein